MQTQYPQVKLHILKGKSVDDLLQGIESGLCQGGISTDSLLLYNLGVSEKYCKYDLVGSKLNFGYYAIPWRIDLKDTVAAATDVFLTQLIESNGVKASQDKHFPPLSSRACPSKAETTQDTSRISLVQMSGIFCVQGAFVIIALIIHFVKTLSMKVNGKGMWWRDNAGSMPTYGCDPYGTARFS